MCSSYRQAERNCSKKCRKKNVLANVWDCSFDEKKRFEIRFDTILIGFVSGLIGKGISIIQSKWSHTF